MQFLKQESYYYLPLKVTVRTNDNVQIKKQTVSKFESVLGFGFKGSVRL